MVRQFRVYVLSLSTVFFAVNWVHAACVSASQEDLQMNIASGLKTVKEISFKDINGLGKATFRSYASVNPGATQFDVLLYRADGKINRVVPLDQSPEVENEDTKIISLAPNHDSLFVVYPPLRAGNTPERWLSVLDPATCEWVGILLDNHTHGATSPAVAETHNVSDPRFKNESHYLEKIKSNYK